DPARGEGGGQLGDLLRGERSRGAGHVTPWWCSSGQHHAALLLYLDLHADAHQGNYASPARTSPANRLRWRSPRCGFVEKPKIASPASSSTSARSSRTTFWIAAVMHVHAVTSHPALPDGTPRKFVRSAVTQRPGPGQPSVWQPGSWPNASSTRCSDSVIPRTSVSRSRRAPPGWPSWSRPATRP